jgi:hypothetical protein
MLYREITAVCSEIHTKHIKQCERRVEFCNITRGGKSRYRKALKA